MPTLFTCPSQISIPAFLNFYENHILAHDHPGQVSNVGHAQMDHFFGCAPLTAKNTKGKHKIQPLSQNAYKKIDILMKSAKGKRFSKMKFALFHAFY